MEKFCSNCGAPVEEGQDVCIKCGHILHKNTNNGYSTYTSAQGRSRIVAVILGIFVGCWGVHSFYLGYTGKGFLQILLTICTFGIAGIWGFIEGILILTGEINTDADGQMLI